MKNPITFSGCFSYHNMRQDYVTIILAINIQNGDIFWEDLIINEFKSVPAHHSEMTAETSYGVKQCFC